MKKLSMAHVTSADNKIKKTLLKRRVYGWLALILMTTFIMIPTLFFSGKVSITEKQLTLLVIPTALAGIFFVMAWVIQSFKVPTKKRIAEREYEKKAKDEIDKL